MAIDASIKLRVYNDALRHLGSRALTSLSEAREPRRVLDDAWGADDEAARYILEQGLWNFAVRTVEALASASVEPSFGFAHAFDKPADFVRLAGIAREPHFVLPLTSRDFTDEGGFWFSDCNPLYIRYVSDSDDYGMNAAAWPETFRRLLGMWLAFECCERITNSTDKRRDLERRMKAMKTDAQSKDAMNEGVQMPPPGGWALSRAGGLMRWNPGDSR